MKRKHLVVIIMVISVFLIWLFNQEKPLNYDNFKEMQKLSQISSLELEKEGYSKLDIMKIKEFNGNYKNHLALLDMVKNDKLKNYGYDNRLLDGETGIVHDENYFTVQDDRLTYDTTIMDLIRNNGTNRDVARIIIEFEWNTKPDAGNQIINVEFPDYRLEDIYTLLRYENPNNHSDTVYMGEIRPDNYYDVFFIDIDSKKNIHQQDYLLKSGVLVLDIMSYYKGRITPLSITSQYLTETFFGKEKILSEQKIMNVEVKMP